MSNKKKSTRDYMAPYWLYYYYDKYLGRNFTLDASPNRTGSLCEHFYTNTFDPLQQDWHKYESVWCVAPHGKLLKDYIKKAHEESKLPCPSSSTNSCTITMLCPVQTHKKYWASIPGFVSIEYLCGKIEYTYGHKLVNRVDSYPSCVLTFNNDQNGFVVTWYTNVDIIKQHGIIK
jgi:hypothetical protein